MSHWRGKRRPLPRGYPYPEVDVSHLDDEGDFRDIAVEFVSAFKEKYGRWPNYVGVSLGQVERLEDAYGLRGGRGVTHMTGIARGSIPLLFVGP